MSEMKTKNKPQENWFELPVLPATTNPHSFSIKLIMNVWAVLSMSISKGYIADRYASNITIILLYRYFDWVHRLQAILLEWKQKFMEQRINYDEILTYANHKSHLDNLAQAILAFSTIVDTKDMQTVKNTLVDVFEQLNVLLIKYIPGQPDAKWCTLPSLLQCWGVALPPYLLDPISRHILLPGENKAGELLDNQPLANISGIFQPGHDISLKLTKALTLHKLSDLVEGLKTFLQPIKDVLDMLVFFKLHPCKMFDKYLQVYLLKESKPEVSDQHSTTIHFSSTFPVTSMWPRLADQSEVEGLPLSMLLRALNCTHDLIMKIMHGTAAYSEITAEGELNLDKLNIEQEFSTLDSFSTYLKLPLASCEGLAGVRIMLELFQYIHHIRTIHRVCEQYQLHGCLEDTQLVELLHMVEDLGLEKNCAKLTPLEASEKVERVKKTLCLSSGMSPFCLELFTAVGDSTVFYQFIRDKQFVGEKGHAMFHQQYQLITAQLQHEEYNETVLNHLYAAFMFIKPFMDTHQNFHQLMSQVTSLDVTNGLKQLETVNTNITLIQLWFSHIGVSREEARGVCTNLALPPVYSAEKVRLA